MSVFFRVEDPVEGSGGISVPDLTETGIGDGLNGGDGPSPAVLAWLQGLLHERFHNDLILQHSADGHCTLSVPCSARRIRIRCDFRTFRDSAADLPCAEWAPGVDTWLPDGCTSLPAPGVVDLPPETVEYGADGGTLHYDVLGLAYWMLSRREEVGSKALDRHGRFPATASHAWRHGYLDRPIVDEWFDVLRELMVVTWPELPLRRHCYGLTLSHDVDTPARYGLVSLTRLAAIMLLDLLRDRERDRQALLQAPSIWAASRQRLDPRDPYNTFDWIMERSEEMGLRNAFYFICGHTDRRRDGHYHPEDPAILDLMCRIHERGHEIGLHPSYNTFLDPAALRAEADRLRRACERAGISRPSFGARMHYLRWRMPATLHGLEAAGLVYDTSLGYADQPGFRCGTCHEYQAFDPVLERPLNLCIRPLIVMEATVMGRLDPDSIPQAETRLQRLMDACRRAGGHFTLLWHNTMLEQPYQRQLYDRVLAHYKDATA